ncbi:MAG: hypothetical protein ACRDNL_10735 [Spirillospora sp.]
MPVPAHDKPLIPQPPATVSALRKAIMEVNPAWLPEFTRDLGEAVEKAESEGSFVPFRSFCLYWGAYVYIYRQPELASRFQELEDRATKGKHGIDEVRAAASEIGRILDEAYAAVLEDMRS